MNSAFLQSTVAQAAPLAEVCQQEQRFREAIALHGAELARFMAGYERDEAKRRELLQELQLALWQSLAGFKGDCSLRTWVYRVAHNVGASHVQRSLRLREGKGLDLEELEASESASLSDQGAAMQQTERAIDLARIMGWIHRLKMPDRELMLLYLEGLDAAAIGEVTALSARNVATKIHRIKALLAAKHRAGSA
ncbi:sigma-70 family RNA polymerase sigma factor [Paucibacter sp. TC2R-5]|uniref:RNA polymerase sigma factor n=1 Tax=Paucibacter sp. TC2R-5 TaxID=2893555 RepID=UPI0021E40A6F|nr:sigma-70 family RNA polymerase sigma factor [Paucibacter sp. TC2R-5]MCV2359921.1 sigma-70 family RNA polymerase sigma factor [Paucibacter sp. TC2R-5]